MKFLVNEVMQDRKGEPMDWYYPGQTVPEGVPPQLHNFDSKPNLTVRQLLISACNSFTSDDIKAHIVIDVLEKYLIEEEENSEDIPGYIALENDWWDKILAFLKKPYLTSAYGRNSGSMLQRLEKLAEEGKPKESESEALEGDVEEPAEGRSVSIKASRP